MLRWKNIPISELTEKQLREALVDSVTMNINTQGTYQVGSAFQVYLGGILTGGLISGAGILFSSLLS